MGERKRQNFYLAKNIKKMQTNKVKLVEMTLKEVKSKEKFEVAILPWGSCEPHNLHLPYGCDSLTVEKISIISAEKANKKGAKIIVLPTIPIGVNSNLFGFPMTLHFSPSTQLAIIKDILRAIEIHKIYKLLIINGHGGNEFKAILREVYGFTKVHIFLLDWWKIGEDICKDVCEDTSGEHGNESETSWMMYLYPNLVHLEWADDGKVKKSRFKELEEKKIWMTRPWHLLTTNSGYGNPKKATEKKGEKIVEVSTDRISSFLIKLSKTKLDKKFPY